jgi:hypothetical protein
MRFDFRSGGENGAVRGGTAKWSKILRALKEESGLPLYDDAFEEWALAEWRIRFLHENTEFPGHLTGVELDDSTYTMILLKFQLD